MGGGLMQLVAYGAQDVYLTGSPQITFFKLVYRRHTNFAIESIEQVFQGTPSWGQKATVTISRNGDLITDMFLQITLPVVDGQDAAATAETKGPFIPEMFQQNADGELLDANGVVLTYNNAGTPTEWTVENATFLAAIGLSTATLATVRTALGGAQVQLRPEALIRGPFEAGLFRHKSDTDGKDYLIDKDKDFLDPKVALDDATFKSQREDPTKTLVHLEKNYAGLVYTGPLHSYQYADAIGHRLMEACEIEIGGQRIDKHYSPYYEVWDALRTPETKRVGYGRMIGKTYRAPEDESKLTKLDEDMGHRLPVTLYVPLRFWFNGNPGLALPLIALQYHEVKVMVTLGKHHSTMYRSRLPENRSYGKPPSEAPDMSVAMWVDYVYLDTEERRRFAQASHEYLIEQLQFTGLESFQLQPTVASMHKVRLNFNHPTKELIWFVRNADADADALNFGERTKNARTNVLGYEYVQSAKLLLNGHDRFADRPGSYFRLVVPYLAHTRVPRSHVYVYSFALRPEEHQCSGSLNLSRIDNASLHVTLAPSSIQDADDNFVHESVHMHVYAVSYNVLRIVSGMGGLAYSN